MNYLQKLGILSLLLLPISIYCMEKDTAIDESSTDLEEVAYEGIDPHDKHYEEVGRKIAGGFQTYLLNKYADLYNSLGTAMSEKSKLRCTISPKSSLYDYRNEVVAQLLTDYENRQSPEQARLIFTRYQSLYHGMNQELVLSRLDFLHLVQRSPNYPVQLKQILIGDFEQALNYVQIMSFKFHTMEEVLLALPPLRKATEDEKVFYQCGKRIADLQCTFLKQFGLSVQKHAEWAQLRQAYKTERQALNKRLLELSLNYEHKLLYELWRAAYKGYCETLLPFNLDVCFAEALQHVDLTTTNIEELAKIQGLKKAMAEEKECGLDYIFEALLCKNIEDVIKFINNETDIEKDIEHLVSLKIKYGQL